MQQVESRASMNREIICSWLGLTDTRWPPEPYALLGLAQEDCNVSSIERRVHERMTQLRGYQLLHPEEATEAMTRVTQAYIVLIERHGSRSETKPSPPPAAPPRAPSPAPAAPAWTGPAPSPDPSLGPSR
jgi:hypothetical protein